MAGGNSLGRFAANGPYWLGAAWLDARTGQRRALPGLWPSAGAGPDHIVCEIEPLGARARPERYQRGIDIDIRVKSMIYVDGRGVFREFVIFQRLTAKIALRRPCGGHGV